MWPSVNRAMALSRYRSSRSSRSEGTKDGDGDEFFDTDEKSLLERIDELPEELQQLIHFKSPAYYNLHKRNITHEFESGELWNVADIARKLADDWNTMEHNPNILFGEATRLDMTDRDIFWRASLADALYWYFGLTQSEKRKDADLQDLQFRRFRFSWEFPEVHGGTSNVRVRFVEDDETTTDVLLMNRGVFEPLILI